MRGTGGSDPPPQRRPRRWCRRVARGPSALSGRVIATAFAQETGLRFGCVLADAGYGLSAAFRQGLGERGLAWAVGIARTQKVYPADVAMIFPVAGRGRPRRRPVPDVASVPAQAMLESARWRSVTWRRGTKGRLAARFAAVRVRVADGEPQRIGAMGAQHLPGEEVWLVGEPRSSGERECCLSDLPTEAPLKRLAGAFLQSRRLAEARRGRKDAASPIGTAAKPEPASRPRPHHQRLRSATSGLMPEWRQ